MQTLTTFFAFAAKFLHAIAMLSSPLLLTLLSVLLVSLISLVGIVLFSLHERLIRKSLLLLVGFSAGALLGDVFIHIFPEMLEKEGFAFSPFLLVLGGMLLSFVIEKVIHWRHCHCSALPKDSMHIHPVGIMNLIGDAIHNFIDGALIAGSYLINPQIGVATTIAVVLHEIPQEIGDFAVLLFSGFTTKRATLFNLLSACTAFAGAIVVLAAAHSLPFLGMYLLPIAAGNFLYIAGADLMPELHKETRLSRAVLQLIVILLGLSVMQLLTFVE
ncbi:MAG: ZIP family metal transporter [Candidatus Peribacteraceae bacterium]|jgi:zinc and cadmium transporter|nr:ZIP family metal transporter [Candidatus Peribacteraceae bacterium]